jgi:outer membrane protein assembly factor BamE
MFSQVFAFRAARRTALWLAIALITGSQVACSTGLWGVSPYQVDIQQGNVVTREQAEAIKPGMPRVQVQDMLGSPLVISLFHANRWDYVFSFRRQGQPVQQRKLTVVFQDDKVARVETDALPTEAEFVAALDVRRPSRQPVALEASEEQLKAFQERNAAPAAPAAAAPTGAAPVAYPPLESAGASR